VLEAQGESPAALEALEKLCRTYWRPIYGFVRRQGVGPEEAKALLRLDPLWDPLRADPAFQKLCEEKQPPAMP